MRKHRMTAMLFAGLVLCSVISGCAGETPGTASETPSQATENGGPAPSGEDLAGDYDYTHTIRTGEDAAVDKTMVEADRAKQFEAMLATVFAYYNKNPYCQYDESHVTMEAGYANYCRNVPVWDQAPEFASNDQ